MGGLQEEAERLRLTLRARPEKPGDEQEDDDQDAEDPLLQLRRHQPAAPEGVLRRA